MRYNFILILLAVCFSASAQNSTLKHNTAKEVVFEKVAGYLEHLPPDYSTKLDKKYPLLVFLHGSSERSSNTANLYKIANYGPPKEIENNGKLCFTVNGTEECFIVLSPMKSGTGNWSGAAQKEFWEYILNGPESYRYDPNRIYLTGLSLGGNGCYERAYSPENATNQLAAIAPLCAWGDDTKGCTIADRKIPVWAFHGTADPTISYFRGEKMFNAVNNCASNTQNNIFTTLEGENHYIWNKVYDPDNAIYGSEPNIYEWLLNQRLNNCDTCNVKPTVDAGNEQTVSTTTTSVTFTATASDPDGSIVSYNWVQTGGTQLTLNGQATNQLTVSNLAEGTFTFQVTVKDNENAEATDSVNLIVQDASAPLSVDAGPDRNITLPKDTVQIHISTSIPDQEIDRYVWRKLEGSNNINIYSYYNRNLTFGRLVADNYKFEVTIFDFNGNKATDTVNINISDANQGFTIDLGPDQIIYLPQSNYTIVPQLPSGYTITKYAWENVSEGTSNLNFWSYSGSTLTFGQLHAGTHKISLEVTEAGGAVATDVITIEIVDSGARLANPNENNLLEEVPQEFNKNIITTSSNLRLFNSEKMLNLSLISMEGRQISRQQTTGAISLENVINGTYIYLLTDDSNNVLGRGRIITMVQ